METESGGLIKVGKKIEVNNALMNEKPKAPLFDNALRLYVPKLDVANGHLNGIKKPPWQPVNRHNFFVLNNTTIECIPVVESISSYLFLVVACLELQQAIPGPLAETTLWNVSCKSILDYW